jgi:hypothetical protein
MRKVWFVSGLTLILLPLFILRCQIFSATDEEIKSFVCKLEYTKGLQIVNVRRSAGIWRLGSQ